MTNVAQQNVITPLILMGIDDFYHGRFVRFDAYAAVNSLIGHCSTQYDIEPDGGCEYYLSKLMIDELNRAYLSTSNKSRLSGFFSMLHYLERATADAPSQFCDETRLPYADKDFELYRIFDADCNVASIFIYLKEHDEIHLISAQFNNENQDEALKRNRLVRQLIDSERQIELLAHAGLNEEQARLVDALNNHGRLIPYAFGYWSMPDAPMKQIESGRHAGKLIPEWYFTAGTVNALIRRGVAIVTKGGGSDDDYEPNKEVMLATSYTLTS